MIIKIKCGNCSEPVAVTVTGHEDAFRKLRALGWTINKEPGRWRVTCPAHAQGNKK